MSGGDLSQRPGVCNTKPPSPPGRHILALIQLCQEHTSSLEECKDGRIKNKCSRIVN